jgi:RNA polymerase sigma factor (sigma-70 family)
LTTDESVRIDPAAVAALHAAHVTELRAFLIGVLRDGELADEALQVTFGKVIEQGHTAREESLKGWLFRVALHEALLLRRRRVTEQRILTRVAIWWKRESESPEHTLNQRDNVELVRRALERLTPDQRIVVHKKIYEEKTFAAIAGELGLPLGTVLSRMRAALQNLRRDLQGRE